MEIKILSDSTINKIAAGEVIERPASVVKELVENAIDAGATEIIIKLESAGKNLISIRDNGSGMTKDQLKLAIRRHATSKLNEDNLLDINSFGFRGEALPSIASISKFKISSRRYNEEEGYSIEIHGGNEGEIKPASLQKGTLVEVRDLFFSTPARLKFLRTDRTEIAAINNIVKRIALAHPEIAFSYFHGKKEILSVRNNYLSDEEPLLERIKDIMGKEFAENSEKLDISRDEIKIYGRTALPTYNKATMEDQFLFINRRPVRDKLLNAALRIAYQDYLARDRHPVTALFIEVLPSEVDVNVHPAKTEVRFYDPNHIRGIIISALKDALQSSSNRVSNATSANFFSYAKPLGTYKQPLTIDKPSGDNKPSGDGNSLGDNKLLGEGNPLGINSNFVNNPIGNSRDNSMVNFRNKVEEQGRGNSGTNSGQFAMPYASEKCNTTNENTTNEKCDTTNVATPDPIRPTTISKGNEDILFNPEPSARVYEDHSLLDDKFQDFQLGAAKTQLHKNYIISQTRDSFIITDQHAAHERLGYEKLKKMIAKEGLVKQRLLIPEIIELNDEHKAELLSGEISKLSKLGLTIEKFGETGIIVTEIPSILGEINVSKLIQDLADQISSTGEAFALDDLIEHVTETYACHCAIRSGRILNIQEMNALLREMEITAFSGQCNHGRQTYVELKLTDIEKLFGRR